MQNREENPNGFHARYNITKADGTPCDPDAVYFVLRVDAGGSDPDHIAACRSALRVYAYEALNVPHLSQLGSDLLALLQQCRNQEDSDWNAPR